MIELISQMNQQATGHPRDFSSKMEVEREEIATRRAIAVARYGPKSGLGRRLLLATKKLRDAEHKDVGLRIHVLPDGTRCDATFRINSMPEDVWFQWQDKATLEHCDRDKCSNGSCRCHFWNVLGRKVDEGTSERPRRPSAQNHTYAK